jgi:hypothetical protein
MPARSPNIQAIALIASFTFNTLGALWIYADARARRADKPLFAALAMVTLGPLWLAFYMTDRPLHAGERRRGGFGWTWTRNFCLAWTASLAPWLGAAMLRPPAMFPPTRPATTTILFMLIAWLAPVLAATAIGALIGRPDATANETGVSAPARTPVPLAAVAALAGALTCGMVWLLM